MLTIFCEYVEDLKIQFQFSFAREENTFPFKKISCHVTEFRRDDNIIVPIYVQLLGQQPCQGHDAHRRNQFV